MMKLTKQQIHTLLKNKYYHIARPQWIDNYAHFHFFSVPERNVVQMNVFLNKQIEYDQYLYWQDNKLIRIDKNTGKESIVMCYSYEPLIICKAEISENAIPELLHIIDFSILNEVDYVKLSLS